MNETKDVPKLRFRQFENRWEEKKLNEIVSFKSGKFPHDRQNKKWYSENGVPFIKVADVCENMQLTNNPKTLISEEAQKQCLFAKKGSLLATWKGSIGRIAIAQYDCYIDSSILLFDDFHAKTDLYFFAHVLIEGFAREVNKAQGVIAVLKENDVKNFNLLIPTYEEQKRIGETLKKQHELILLEEKKIYELQELKKAFLQKMFV